MLWGGNKYLVLTMYESEVEEGPLHFTQLFWLVLSSFSISPDKKGTEKDSDQDVSSKVSYRWLAQPHSHDSLQEH